MSRARDIAFRALCSPRVVLGFLGVLAVARGIFYLPAFAPSDRIPALEEYLPLPWWAALWIIVGVVTLAAAVTRRGMAGAVGVQVGVSGMWAGLYLVAYLGGWSQRGYVTATTYLALSLLVMAYYARIDMAEEA